MDAPDAEVGLDVEPGQQVAIGLQRPGGERAAAVRRVARHPALAGDLDAARVRGLGIVGVGGEVLMVGVRPHLAAGAVGDRVRLAAVVGVGVGDDHELHVLDPQPDLVERALEVGERAGLVRPGVDEHDAVAGRDRPRVAVRDARPRQREPQSPEPGEHALAAPHLPRSGRLAHGAGRYCPGMAAPKDVMTAYFDALADQNLDAIAAAWAPDGAMTALGVEVVGPAGLRAYWAEFFGAIPDFRFEVQDIVADGDQVAVHWAGKGTFAGPNAFQGIEPTFARLDLAGLDLFDLRDGQIVREHAYTDGADFARQVGLLPPAGSTAEQRVTRAFNGQAKLKRQAVCNEPERIAEGVWLVRGGFPLKSMNVYLIEDADGGVTMFEAGIKAMVAGLSAACAQLGGLNRIVLGHAHADHRGAAPGLGGPVLCHPDDRVDAEGDGGAHYFDFSKATRAGALDAAAAAAGVGRRAGEDHRHGRGGRRRLGLRGRPHPRPLAGPDRAVARVRPDRADRRLLLHASTPAPAATATPRVPMEAVNLDTEQARASIRKIAALEPSAAWPGHADPVTGDVRAQLEQAAAET